MFCNFCEKFENSKWPPFLTGQYIFENWVSYSAELPCGSKKLSKLLYLAQFLRYKHFCVLQFCEKMPVKRRAPEPSREDEVPKKHKRRPACFMKSCKKPQSHMRRHVIGRHLPEGFMTWIEMSNEVRIESIVNFTTTIQNLLGCKTLDDLITKICKDRLYPDLKIAV